MKNILNRFLSGALVLLLVFSAVLSAGMPARADETASFARELKEGDTGADVLALQQRLTNLGYYPGA